jgi:hypothetical protein
VKADLWNILDGMIVLVPLKCRATFEFSLIGTRMLKNLGTLVHVALQERSSDPARSEYALHTSCALPVVLAILSIKTSELRKSSSAEEVPGLMGSAGGTKVHGISVKRRSL